MKYIRVTILGCSVVSFNKKILFEGLKVKLRLAHILKDNILVCWTLERMQVKRPSH